MEEEKKTKSSYTRGQRIFAIVGVLLLLALYLITLISAITTSPAAPALFKACIGASMLLPIMLWCYVHFGKLLMGGKGKEE